MCVLLHPLPAALMHTLSTTSFGEVEIGARWGVALRVETARRNVTGRIPLFSCL